VSVTSGALAIVLLVYLGPIQSVLWNGDQAPEWAAALPWVESSIVAARSTTPGLPAYDMFGRGVVAVYVAVLVAWAALWPPAGAARVPRLWAGATMAALCCAAAADIVAYWIAGLNGSTLREAAFWAIEVPALCVTVLTLAGTGWVMRGRSGCRALILAPLLAVIATVALRYMPHGPLLGIAGAIMLSALRRAAPSANPTWI
jgi:hypothetical protein